MKTYYAGRFENNSGIMLIVDAYSVAEARAIARDPHYGTPGIVRLATQDEIDWYRGMTAPIPTKPKLSRREVINILRELGTDADASIIARAAELLEEDR